MLAWQASVRCVPPVLAGMPPVWALVSLITCLAAGPCREVGAQPAWLQQVGQLPRIDDTSDRALPTVQPQHDELQQPAGPAGQQAAGDALHAWQQQQQQQAPAHMCFKEQPSRDVLVLLSDCDATNDSLRSA